MKTTPKVTAGPTEHSAFFDALAEVFDRYPEEARHYAVKTTTLETDVLHIDFTKQRAVSWVEDNRIITEFHDRDAQLPRSSTRKCCEWVKNGRWTCVMQCPV